MARRAALVGTVKKKPTNSTKFVLFWTIQETISISRRILPGVLCQGKDTSHKSVQTCLEWVFGENSTQMGERI